MDLKKTNPCEYEWYAKLLAWAETDCWCCSTTRGIVVSAAVAFPIGMMVGGGPTLGIMVGIFTIAAALAILRLAREAWDDGSEEGEKK